MLTRFAAATALGLVMSLAPAAAQQSNQPSGSTGAKVEVVPAQQQDEMLAQNVIGSNVYNHQNEKIGDINDLVIDRDGKVKAIVVGVGGFLGIGERNVAIPYHEAKIMHRAVYDQMYGNRGSSANRGTGAGPTTTGTTTATGTAGTPPAGTPGSVNAPAGAGTTAAANQPTDRDLRFVVDASKDQLKNMPAFTRLSDRNRSTATRDTGGGPSTTGATGSTGMGTGGAAGTGGASGTGTR